MRASGGRTRRAVIVVVAVIAATMGVPTPSDAAESWWWPIEQVEGSERLVATHDGRVLAAELNWSNVLVWLQSLDGTWGELSALAPPGHTRAAELAPVVTDDATYLMFRVDAAATGERFVTGAQLDGDTWTPLPLLPVVHGEWLAAAGAPDGSVQVAWADDYEIRTSVLADGAWGAIEDVPESSVQSTISLAVTDAGERVLGYANPQGIVRAHTDAGGSWGAPVTVSPPGANSDGVRLLPADDGGAFAVFVQGAQLRASTYRSGGWAPSVTIRTLGADSDWDVDLDADGRALLAVQDLTESNGVRTLQVNVWAGSGSGWSGPQQVFSDTGILDLTRGQRMDLAVGADGTAAITTSLWVPYQNYAVAILRDRGGRWTPPAYWEVGDLIAYQSPTVAVDRFGYVHVGWNDRVRLYRMAMAVPFSDLQPGAFFTFPAIWAYDVGLSTGVGGTDQFQPNRSITRAEAITALWRLEGSPTGAPASGFADVAANAFYTPAVNWARAEGYTTGVAGANVFQPDRTITRAELLTLLWRSAGSPGAPASGFEDVAPGAFYATAVGWARQLGITTGVAGTNRFEPNRSITRGETFTLIYRFVDAVSASPSTTAAVVRPDVLLLGATDRTD